MTMVISLLCVAVGFFAAGVAASDSIQTWWAGQRGKTRVVSYRKPERTPKPKQNVTDIAASNREQV